MLKFEQRYNDGRDGYPSPCSPHDNNDDCDSGSEAGDDDDEAENLAL